MHLPPGRIMPQPHNHNAAHARVVVRGTDQINDPLHQGIIGTAHGTVPVSLS